MAWCAQIGAAHLQQLMRHIGIGDSAGAELDALSATIEILSITGDNFIALHFWDALTDLIQAGGN